MKKAADMLTKILQRRANLGLLRARRLGRVEDTAMVVVYGHGQTTVEVLFSWGQPIGALLAGQLYITSASNLIRAQKAHLEKWTSKRPFKYQPQAFFDRILVVQVDRARKVGV